MTGKCSCRCLWSFWTSLALLGLLCLAIDVVQGATEDEMKCTIVWKDGGVLENEEKWNIVDQKCLESSQFDESKLIGLSPNTTLEDFDIDDNCYVQCSYKAEGLLTSDDSIDKTKTESIFKGNLTAEVVKQAVSMWDGCTDDAEKIAAKKGLTKCKMLTLHDFCFTQRAMMDSQLFTLQCM